MRIPATIVTTPVKGTITPVDAEVMNTPCAEDGVFRCGTPEQAYEIEVCPYCTAPKQGICDKSQERIKKCMRIDNEEINGAERLGVRFLGNNPN